MTQKFKTGDIVEYTGPTAALMSSNEKIETGSVHKILGFTPRRRHIQINECQVAEGVGLKTSKFKLVEQQETKSLDFTKPLQTRKGEAVTLLSYSGRGDFPVVGYIGESKNMSSWTSSGGYFDDETSDEDLQNVPDEFVRYVNMYRGPSGVIYFGAVLESRKCADWVGEIDNNNSTRIACNRVVLVEGQFDN